MIRVFLLFLALALPARAETARVLSGEHADFTRLVIELPAADGWRVGRTAMGYAFAQEGTTQPAYDLSSVWKRIPRTRLQALRVDPDTGALTLTLACLCHILPFEYRPGTIVLDIRNGPAPEASAFEVPFQAAEVTAQSIPPMAEVPLVYDWRAGLPQTPKDDVSLPLATGGASLAPLRDALFAQISRGAVEGLVDMQLPGGDLPVTGGLETLDWARVGLAPLPGVELGLGEPQPEPADSCLSDDDLALADWGAGRPPLELLSEARSGLYGEFDTAAPDELLNAVRVHLYLGFGAEARQYALLLPEADRPEILGAFLSMASLVDGESDPDTPFAGMLGCDGAAAMWAALAHSSLPTVATVNVDAIARNFTALPPHLRRHLGPDLADLLLPRDAAAARMIRDSMARTPDMAPGKVALADAREDLQAGRPEEALLHAEQAMSDGLPATEGLIALVEAHAKALRPLPPETAEAVLAMQKDAGPGAEGQAAQRASVLALALSGQTEQAFALAGLESAELADLWAVTVVLADDSKFLVQAVAVSDPVSTMVGDSLVMQIAARLIRLGFPDAALVWLGPADLADPPEWRLLAAEASLGIGDARQALTLVTGLEGEAALDLRRRAETALGALEAAQRSAEAAGLAEEALRLSGWSADWPALAATDQSPWAVAASYAVPSDPKGEGPLDRGAALLETSADARTAIEELLSVVAPPNP